MIRGPKNWRQWSPLGGQSIEVEVKVPSGSHLVGEAGVAAVQTDGLLGEVNFRTGVGDIRVDECDTLRTKTGLGDVIAGRAAGDVDVKTGTGRVELRTVDGRAVVRIPVVTPSSVT